MVTDYRTDYLEDDILQEYPIELPEHNIREFIGLTFFFSVPFVALLILIIGIYSQ